MLLPLEVAPGRPLGKRGCSCTNICNRTSQPILKHVTGKEIVGESWRSSPDPLSLRQSIQGSTPPSSTQPARSLAPGGGGGKTTGLSPDGQSLGRRRHRSSRQAGRTSRQAGANAATKSFSYQRRVQQQTHRLQISHLRLFHRVENQKVVLRTHSIIQGLTLP